MEMSHIPYLTYAIITRIALIVLYTYIYVCVCVRTPIKNKVTDEMNCTTEEEPLFYCDNYNSSFPVSFICDTYPDCNDGLGVPWNIPPPL